MHTFEGRALALKGCLRAVETCPTEVDIGIGLLAGQKVLGKPGRYIVAFFALCEFFGGSCVMMMLMCTA